MTGNWANELVHEWDSRREYLNTHPDTKAAFIKRWNDRLDAALASEPVAGTVTDAMCEAAIDIEWGSRSIQGFSYEKRHVIRNVSLPPGQQEIWSTPVAGPDEYEAFQRQCRVERMRVVLGAALSALPPQVLGAGEPAPHPVQMSNAEIADGLDEYRREWPSLELPTADLLNCAAQRLRATPPAPGAADRAAVPVEIRRNDDRSIDEIVAHRCDIHIEQMSGHGWFMSLDPPDGSQWRFWFGASNQKSLVVFRHDETIPAPANTGETGRPGFNLGKFMDEGDDGQ